jgi:hypothetical protein
MPYLKQNLDNYVVLKPLSLSVVILDDMSILMIIFSTVKRA